MLLCFWNQFFAKTMPLVETSKNFCSPNVPLRVSNTMCRPTTYQHLPISMRVAKPGPIR